MNKILKSIVYPLAGISLLASFPKQVYAGNPEKEPLVFYYESRDAHGDGVFNYPQDYTGIKKFGPIAKPTKAEAGKPLYLHCEKDAEKCLVFEKGEKPKSLENLAEGTDGSDFKLDGKEGKYRIAVMKGKLKTYAVGKIVFE
jgi:hypothetical protein